MKTTKILLGAIAMMLCFADVAECSSTMEEKPTGSKVEADENSTTLFAEKINSKAPVIDRAKAHISTITALLGEEINSIDSAIDKTAEPYFNAKIDRETTLKDLVELGKAVKDGEKITAKTADSALNNVSGYCEKIWERYKGQVELAVTDDVLERACDSEEMKNLNRKWNVKKVIFMSNLFTKLVNDYVYDGKKRDKEFNDEKEYKLRSSILGALIANLSEEDEYEKVNSTNKVRWCCWEPEGTKFYATLADAMAAQISERWSSSGNLDETPSRYIEQQYSSYALWERHRPGGSAWKVEKIGKKRTGPSISLDTADIKTCYAPATGDLSLLKNLKEKIKSKEKITVGDTQGAVKDLILYRRNHWKVSNYIFGNIDIDHDNRKLIESVIKIAELGGEERDIRRQVWSNVLGGIVTILAEIDNSGFDNCCKRWNAKDVAWLADCERAITYKLISTFFNSNLGCEDERLLEDIERMYTANALGARYCRNSQFWTLDDTVSLGK